MVENMLRTFAATERDSVISCQSSVYRPAQAREGGCQVSC